ncbi:hypothetical protein HMPREF6123_0647 [Oribacterium sinus F0268]|uniref:Twitching motility protein PilT n=1 Tax=Oribacterium sinus F0268 TaxID=585501 RepID=C2KVX8_9FIRM|nr:hypothetical protein HMPREF6123_0647 [Oribacterium sinus F0268]
MHMVQFIVGQRGKGKTKQLIDRANKAVTEAKGTVDFLDRSSQHMYELNNKVRLINVNLNSSWSRRMSLSALSVELFLRIMIWNI